MVFAAHRLAGAAPVGLDPIMALPPLEDPKDMDDEDMLMLALDTEMKDATC